VSTPAERIRAGIDSEGLTIEQFAVSFGVASKTVSRWLNGKYPPRRTHARLLAERWGGDWRDYTEHEGVAV
jgi:transcriptional regulator with XRE-family HTH domain